MLHLHFLLVRLKTKRTLKKKKIVIAIGRKGQGGGGGARRAAVPPNFGQLRFFGQQEKISAKPVLKDVSMIRLIILKK